MRARCASLRIFGAVGLWIALMAAGAGAQELDSKSDASLSELPAKVAAKLAESQANVRAAQVRGDAHAEARALRALADLDLRVSEYKKAATLYEQALSKAKETHDALLQSAALSGLGACSRSLSQNQKALEFFQQALAVATGAGDEHGQAEALNGIGWVKVNMGQREEGLQLHNKALAIADKLGDADLQASILNRIGVVKDIAGENDAAIDLYNRALAKWREIGDEDGEAKALNNIAIVYVESGNPKKALEFYGQALPFYHEAGDRAGEAALLNNLGVLYKHIGEERLAVEYYERVLPLQRALRNRAGEAAALNNLGNAYSALGQNRQAMQVFEQSLAIHLEMGDQEGEAGALHNIGELWVMLGDMQKALEVLQQALHLWTAVDERRGEANTLNAIGIVYDDLGQSEKALDFYLRALDLYKQVNDADGEATVATNFAGLLNAPGQKQKALEYYQIALDLQRSIHDRDGEAKTLNNMGLVYDDLKQREKAQAHFEQALSIWRETGERNGEAQALDNLGSLWRDAGDSEKARQYYAQALPQAKTVSNPLREAQLFHDMMLNDKDRAPTLAVFYGKQAVNLVQHAREQMQGLEKGLQHSFLNTKSEYYHDLAELLIGQGRLPEAQQVLDLLKDQEYADYTRGGADKSLSLLSLTPGEQQAREDYEKSTAQIVSLGEEWMQLKRNAARTSEQEARYQQVSDQLNAASKGLNDFYARLYTAFGNTADANKDVADIKGSVSALKQLIAREPHTVGLYTLVGKERYSVIVITGSTTVAREYTIAAGELNKKVALFQQVLRDRMQDPRAAAAELYRILIGPVAPDLEQAKAETLIWSLDGVLRYVPMGALYDGSKYLVERYNTVTITPASIAHLADVPDVSRLTAVGMGISQKFEDGLPPLPSVAMELDDVIQNGKTGNQRGALQGTVLLNGEFTEKAMETLLERQVAVVHIASHFVFKPGDDSQSYLLLAGKDEDKHGFHLSVAEFRDDQRISLDDTQLLTLSACETGMSGTGSNGREIDGLGTTAQLKGAKAVISSLWEVNDASTGVLMADFYKRWVGGAGKVTKAEALREAQLDLLRDKTAGKASADGRGFVTEGANTARAGAPGYAHPYYWAPFVLMGNWK